MPVETAFSCTEGWTPVSPRLISARRVTLLLCYLLVAADVEEPLALPADEVAANLTGWLSEWGTVMGR